MLARANTTYDYAIQYCSYKDYVLHAAQHQARVLSLQDAFMTQVERRVHLGFLVLGC